MVRVPATVTIDEDKILEMLGSDEAVDYVIIAAMKGAEFAKQTMPVNTGHEHDSVFAGNPSINDEGIAEAQFGSTSSTWHLVEYGSATNPPYRVFRNAVDRLGLKFEEVSK